MIKRKYNTKMAKSINLLSREIISRRHSQADILKILLKNRQIENISEFLNPSPPKLKLKLKSAVKLIKSALAAHQNILIYGDYDVDGITATAILWQSLYRLTKNIIPFIPHRQLDGYGVKAKSFFRFQAEKGIKFDLLITVDNGIVADHELAKIKAGQDIKIIITDHHVKNAPLISADAVVHSTEISGAGVSWFLAKEFDKNADLGLAALGTVADCLPLIGINRSMVVHGLKELRLNPSPGIKKLIQIANLKIDRLSAYDLGFVLGPRINAVGRLADPTDALRLLCSQNSLQAAKYAQSLNSFNRDRQILQKESIDLAETKINLQNKIIIIADVSFNPGIIGLIAGRLTEKYYLPSIAIAIDNGLAKGSCRSIPELNIIETLRQHQDLFIDLGGHAAAAGFSLLTKNIPKLKKVLTKSVNLKLNKLKLQPHLDIDAEMNLEAVTLTNIKSVSQLSPFGIGNPEPLFLFKNLKIDGKKIIGSTGDHLKLKFGKIDALAFKKGDLNDALSLGDSVDIVAGLSVNEWNNLQIPQLIIKVFPELT